MARQTAKQRRELAESMEAAAKAMRSDTIADREASLRAEMAAGGLDPANEIRPERVKARLSEVERPRSRA